MLRKTAYQFVGTRSIHMRTHLFLLDAWHWGAFIAAHSYFRRWRGAWRKTARFVVQIFWKFSCAQLVSRRNIAQQFLACETVGFEAWFWAQRHSLLQDCPFSSKPWAWTGSFLQVAIEMLCLTRWGFIAAHSAKLRQHAYLLQFDKLFPKHPALPPASVYHICFPLSSPGMLHNAASTISMCCLAAKDQTNIFLSQCKQKRLCCACMLLPKQVVLSKQVSRSFINSLI